jgi:hypothetical protein
LRAGTFTLGGCFALCRRAAKNWSAGALPSVAPRVAVACAPSMHRPRGMDNTDSIFDCATAIAARTICAGHSAAKHASGKNDTSELRQIEICVYDTTQSAVQGRRAVNSLAILTIAGRRSDRIIATDVVACLPREVPGASRSIVAIVRMGEGLRRIGLATVGCTKSRANGPRR